MDRRKILIVVGSLALTIVSVVVGVRTMGPMASAYWHSYFPSQPAPVASPPPGPTTTEPSPVVPASDAAVDAGDRALAELQAELTPEKVAADPLEAVRRYSKISTDYPGTPAASRAQLLARPLQTQNSSELDQANAKALAEIARLVEANRPRLDRLEHRSVIVDWRDVEARYSGMPAAERAAQEREKVQAAWDALPKVEIEASQKFQALPPEPQGFQDPPKRLEIAQGADAIAMRYSNTKFAAVATAYRDRQLDKFVEDVADAATRSNDVARALAKQMPAVFADTDQAKKIQEILGKLKD